MQKHQKNDARGMMPFKFVLLIGGVVTISIIVLALLSAPPKQDASTGQTQTDSQQGQNTSDRADTDSDGSARSDDTSQKVVKIPADFRRFTSKQFGFSVAYPESWGSFMTKPNTEYSSLIAETAPAKYPLGSAETDGTFLVGVYPIGGLTVAIRPGNPLVTPEEKDGKTMWRVTSAEPTDTYRVGNAYPVKSLTTASGLTVFDLTWYVGGKRQSRWVYKSGDNYVLMSVPPLSRPDGQQPTGSDLTFYETFVKSIRDTAGIAKQ